MLILLASMPAVQDRPRQAPVPETAALECLERAFLDAPSPDPQQGVIEEARRRQQRRRKRLTITMMIAVPLIALLGAVIEGGPGNAAPRGAARRGSAAVDEVAQQPAFNVRLAPTLEVGRAGWQVFYEEHGVQVGSTSAGAPTVGSALYLASESGGGGAHRWTTWLLSTPDVAAFRGEGGTIARTVSLPGLPYGYRAAHILRSSELALGSLVQLDAAGQPIPDKRHNRDPSQATVRAWKYPARAPEGVCGLRAEAMPGLTARGGKVASAIRSYSASAHGEQILGHAFLPCALVAYQLHGQRLTALILLDAAHPAAPAPTLPDFKPVRGAPGVFDQGGLTARREGGAWLIVTQGGGVARRVELLRHLTALVKLDSRVPASSGAA